MSALTQVREKVLEMMRGEASGHGSDHVLRVYRLAMGFAEAEAGARPELVGLMALLHDVDDYKLVGAQAAEKLLNARRIMAEADVDAETQAEVLAAIKSMGYSKYLQGIRPATLEGRLVSDADMCEGLGATGIVRVIVYAVSHKGNGVIFDRAIFPNANITQAEYNAEGTTHSTDNAINHFFEKLLKLPGLMMTEAGQKEAERRRQLLLDFLRDFFREEDAPEWRAYLENYLKEQSIQVNPSRNQG